MVDTLEPRQLLADAAAGFNANFNFQPRGETPSGWVADTGAKFSQQDELTYGWNADNGRHMSNRRTQAKLRYDTLAFMGIGASATRWEVQVPNGLYRVKVMAGDARYTNSRYAFDAEGSTILDRRPNKANRWRKGEGTVWVSDGKLTLTSAAGAINNKICSLEVQQIDPNVSGTDIVNPVANASIVVNRMTPGDAIPLLKELGVKNVKLWYAANDGYDALPTAAAIDTITAYKDAGFSTTVTVGLKTVGTYAEAKTFFERLAAAPGATDAVDFWEIGNEPNHPRFWNGTANEFVQNLLRPAYEVLSPLGEPVIGGGATWDVGYCAQLQSLGYSNYCDYAGFHPYANTAAEAIERAVGAKAAFGGKPMIITEWNISGNPSNLKAWANEVRQVPEGLAKVSYLNFYFSLQVSISQTGPAGVYDADLKPNGEFYDVIKDAIS
jgi:hypothetical protein